MSTINSKNVQVGTSGAAAENFTLYQPATPDGTVRLGVGNSGATTSDVVTVNSAGVTVTGSLTATTGTFSGAVQASGVTTNLYPLVSGTAITCANQTSIDFTGIPSWVKRVTVMFSGVSLSGTSSILIQLGDAGGIETTSYVSGTSRASTVVGIDEPTTGFIVYLASATRAADGAVTFSNLTGNTWVVSGVLYNGAATIQVGGKKALSDTLTQVRITTVNGTDTFDTTPSAGSINVLYE